MSVLASSSQVRTICGCEMSTSNIESRRVWNAGPGILTRHLNVRCLVARNARAFKYDSVACSIFCTEETDSSPVSSFHSRARSIPAIARCIKKRVLLAMCPVRKPLRTSCHPVPAHPFINHPHSRFLACIWIRFLSTTTLASMCFTTKRTTIVIPTQMYSAGRID